MTQELAYTSAPRGLKPGSRGFCTVMSTSGMAKNLADRLEALSGYRHAIAPNDPQAHLNPIVFSHLKITVGGSPLHVLSRVCAAGFDYTQRSNKFAHHVVLEPKERVAAGPAALLAAPGFMDASWTGEPRIVPAGRRPPQLSAPAGVCHHWQQATGDAGWAGVLAETVTPGSSRMACVIFTPGTDTLSLVSEALNLLPPAIRWQVSFSTYYTKLPPEVECQWRFVLAGSPEAKAAERAPNVLTIDLSTSLARAPDGPFVAAGRTGVAVALPNVEKPTTTPRPAAPYAQPVVLPPTGKSRAALELDEFDALLTGEGNVASLPPPLRRNSTRRPLWVPIVATTTLVGVVAGVGVFATLRFLAPPAMQGSARAPESSKTEAEAKAAAKAKAAAARKVAAKAKAAAARKVAAKTKAAAAVVAKEVESPYFKFPSAVDLRFDASESGKGNFVSGAATGAARLIKIGSLTNVDLTKMSVHVVGGKSAFESGRIFKVNPSYVTSDSGTFVVRAISEGEVQPPAEFATIAVNDNQVTLKWSSERPADEYERLRNCKLRFTYLGDSKSFALREPRQLRSFRVSFTDKAEPLSCIDKSVSIAFVKDLTRSVKFRVDVPLSPEWSKYDVQSVDNHSVRLKSKDDYMPGFMITLLERDAKLRLTCTWPWPEDESRDPDGKKDKLNEKQTTANIEMRNLAEKLQKRPDKEITEQRNNLQKEIDELQKQIGAIDRFKSLPRAGIPFSVIMEVPDGDSPSEQVVVAEAKVPVR